MVKPLDKYRLAAEQGDAEAQHRLGGMYETGWAAPADLIQSLMWYIIASANGHEAARKARKRVEAELDDDEMSKAQKMARDWAQAH